MKYMKYFLGSIGFIGILGGLIICWATNLPQNPLLIFGGFVGIVCGSIAMVLAIINYNIIALIAVGTKIFIFLLQIAFQIAFNKVEK